MQIEEFQERFKQIPKIAELDHLTVTGDVHWGRNITLRGTVIGVYLDLCEGLISEGRLVAASEGQRIDIPDGCVLENRLLAVNLTMTVSLPPYLIARRNLTIFAGAIIP